MYVDFTYYINEFCGEPVDETDFPNLLLRAEEIVEEMTMYRLNESVFGEMNSEMKERIKKAVCAEVEYLEANGGSEIDSGDNLSSAGLGKFSYSKGASSDGSVGQSKYSPRAMRILMPTGLLYRGGERL